MKAVDKERIFGYTYQLSVLSVRQFQRNPAGPVRQLRNRAVRSHSGITPLNVSCVYSMGISWVIKRACAFEVVARGREDCMHTLVEKLIGDRPKAWNLETVLVGLLGAVFIWQSDLVHSFNVIAETLILVVFLGALLGATRIPLPHRVGGRMIPVWAFPLMCGLISAFMDSFLVLLLVGFAKLEGPEKDQFKFKAYVMIAALIGGLLTYFGEVYMVPLALRYGMRDWYSMLPVVPPVLVFLGVLSVLAGRLDVKVLGMKTIEPVERAHGKKTHADIGDYLEFGAAIALLLLTQNVLLCLGVLLLYASITGQGEDLLDVIRTETEMSVMLLLGVALIIAGPIEPLMQNFSGWLAFVPSTINGVITGAIFPASGNVWKDVHILSTAVLITPLSSLVGVMLFKTVKQWKQYMMVSIPLALVWFVIFGLWLYGPWPLIEPGFENIFGAPQLEALSLFPY